MIFSLEHCCFLFGNFSQRLSRSQRVVLTSALHLKLWHHWTADPLCKMVKWFLFGPGSGEGNTPGEKCIWKFENMITFRVSPPSTQRNGKHQAKRFVCTRGVIWMGSGCVHVIYFKFFFICQRPNVKGIHVWNRKSTIMVKCVLSLLGI